MTIPAFLFGCLVATLLGSLFHLWKGGGLLHILLFILFGIGGFWLGHLAASYWELALWNIGPIHFGPALILCIGFLFLAHWLFNFPAPKKP